MILNEKHPFIENGSVYLKTPVIDLSTSDLLDVYHETGTYLDDICVIISLIEKKKKYNDRKLYRSNKWCYLKGEKVKLQAQLNTIRNEIIRRTKQND